MAGGPKDIYPKLRAKYGDAGTVQIIYAATALWAVTANARELPFVAEVVAKYIHSHAGTPAAKALAALTPKGK